MVKMPLKGEVGGNAFKNSNGNYIFDHGISWKNHEIVFLNFCGNPDKQLCNSILQISTMWRYITNLKLTCGKGLCGETLHRQNTLWHFFICLMKETAMIAQQTATETQLFEA